MILSKQDMYDIVMIVTMIDEQCNTAIITTAKISRLLKS